LKNHILCTAILSLAVGACGEAPPEEIANTESPIVGGENAPVGALPYMVGIFERAKDDEENDSPGDGHFCGGTLIDAQRGLVLTAAHCVSDEYPLGDPDSDDPADWGTGSYPPHFLQVTVGSHKLSEVRAEDLLNVVEVIVHPDFNYEGIASDIAILRVEGVDPSTPTPRVIGSRGRDPFLLTPGFTATVAGWGMTSNSDWAGADVLQWVRLPLMDRNVCNFLLTEEDGPEVDETMMCAGPILGGRDSCYGDSGGPLLVRDIDGRRVLAGIVSWGPEDCALRFKAGVYSNVIALRPWVDGCTTEGGECPRLPTLVE
jgi:secreted trypsin-like serine protease